jgi:hypothetical protein
MHPSWIGTDLMHDGLGQLKPRTEATVGQMLYPAGLLRHQVANALSQINGI